MKAILTAMFLAVTLSTSALAAVCSEGNSLKAVTTVTENTGANAVTITNPTVILNSIKIIESRLGPAPFDVNNVSALVLLSKEDVHLIAVYDLNECFIVAGSIDSNLYQQLLTQANGS